MKIMTKYHGMCSNRDKGKVLREQERRSCQGRPEDAIEEGVGYDDLRFVKRHELVRQDRVESSSQMEEAAFSKVTEVELKQIQKSKVIQQEWVKANAR